MMKKITLRWLLISSVFALIALTALLARTGVSAQSVTDSEWTVPQNLTQSGSIAQPQVLADAAGTMHLFWQDAQAGTGYISGRDGEWTTPLYPLLPFSDPPFATPALEEFTGYLTPNLYVDGNDGLHALWRNDENVLFYGRSNLLEFTTGPDGWTVPVPAATQSLQADLVVGDDGRIHLVSVFSGGVGDVSAGIIYRFSDDGGVTWSDPQTIYQSTYLRDAPPGALVLDLQTGEGDDLYLAWENPFLNQLFLARTGNNGEDWSSPFVIDQRQADDPPEGLAPTGVDMIVNGERIYLTWRAEHAQDECAQYVRFSRDGGVSWSEPEPVFKEGAACPLGGQLFLNVRGDLFLFGQGATSSYLQAFDGESWSLPLEQPALTGFADPETFATVVLNCHHFYVNEENVLFSFNCGRGNADDIWVQSRPLGDLDDWLVQFAPTPVWQPPQLVTLSTFSLQRPRLVADRDGLLHALWSQTGDSAQVGRVGDPAPAIANVIYYSRYDREGGSWTSPRPVINAGEGNKAQDPDPVINPAGTMFLAWSGSDPAGIYFSRVAAQLATSQTEWDDPQLLPAPRAAGEWPDLERGADGRLHVVYTIPANEDRGLYLTSSADNGLTWTAERQIFDGAAAGWDIVGRALLRLSPGGKMHLLWEQRATPPAETITGLSYAYSVDGGESWSEPEVVAEGIILDRGLMVIDEMQLLRSWTELEDGRARTRVQTSANNGIVWEEPFVLNDPDFLPGPQTLIADQARQPLILQIGELNDGTLELREWLRTNNGWVVGQRRPFVPEVEQLIGLDATTGADERLSVIVSARTLDGETMMSVQTHLFTARDWIVDPDAVPTPLPTPTATPTVIPSPTPEPTLTPTPAPTLAPVDPTSPLESGSGGLIAGIGATIVLLGIGFLFGLRQIRAK
jgi:hypothetical protein